MGGDPIAAPSGRRWLLAMAIPVVVFVFTRVRGEIPVYVALHRWLDGIGVSPGMRNLDSALLLIGSSVLAARIAWGRGRTWHGLGLTGSLPGALWFALLSGVPMVLQAALTAPSLRLDAGIARGVLLAPVVEELFFRAVLVGIAVRIGRVPFWPAAVVAGVIFGSVHVPWTSAFGTEHLGVLAATSAGGIWYAWILRGHDWNLWTTILLHAVMNGAWTIFGVADSAAGGLWPNVGRGLTIAVGTACTIRRRRRAAVTTSQENVAAL